MSYMCVIPETKSVKARYIRVAAIDSMITEGSWNICIVDGIRITPALWRCRDKQERTMLNGSGIYGIVGLSRVRR